MVEKLDPVHKIADSCVHCNMCVKECKFLDTYSTPGEICNTFLSDVLPATTIFKCNLCGLCETVCPKNLNIVETFLTIREVITGSQDSFLTQHKRICNYENRGHSKLFSLYEIPDECNTIFFPGCTLSGTKSTITERTYRHLQQSTPNLGIVLDCCHKPSHDIGRTTRFHKKFETIVKRLKTEGIKKIITACPSCNVTFKEFAQDFEVTTVYEELALAPPEAVKPINETVSIHDTCVTRFDSNLQESVRKLTKNCGLTIEEAEHSKENTICCGEGGGAVFVAPETTGYWKELRIKESKANRVITYCAGCSSTLGKDINTSHLLDLLFDTKSTIKNREQHTVSPNTYLRRLQLKMGLKKAHKNQRGIATGKLVLFLSMIAIAIACRVFELDHYLNINEVDKLLVHLKNFPPIIYITLLIFVPVFLLPTFPFVIAGGLLYGTTAGLIYAMIGASTGAAISFLVSRYLGNNFVNSQIEKRIDPTKWNTLQNNTKQHGWKLVLLLRVIPLFPFTPLNYVLGLSNIKFTHYIGATILGILPACSAFILFSTSLWDILHGSNTIIFIFPFILFVIIIRWLIGIRFFKTP